MANFPDRCQHLKVNGTQCGSPALRRNRFCFFHKRFQDERIKLSADRARHGVATFVLPVLEDANSIQVALMQVMRLLVSRQIDHKTASLLLYALQTASTNLRMTTFKPLAQDVILDPSTVGDTALNAHIWNNADFEDDEDEEEEDKDEEPTKTKTTEDRAIQALEADRKKKQHEARRKRLVEAKCPKPNQPASSLATDAAESTLVTPTSSKKPSSREEISALLENFRHG